MSLEARIYFFACTFLWDTLSFFHYLDEEVAERKIGKLYLRWSASYEDLANWALQERFSPIENEKVVRNEEDLLLSTAETLLDSLIFYWRDTLNAKAIEMHKKYSDVSKPMWVYYSYCRFLNEVLSEFDRVLLELRNSPVYYEIYQQNISLFNDMAKALKNERPFLDRIDVSETTIQAVWDQLDAYASKMATEWRQAVHSAARDLKLPDFDENAAN